MYKYLKNSLLALLFAIPFLFHSQKAEASHMMGADITYQCIDSFKFKITLKWYRDCQGIGLNGAGGLTIRCSSGGSSQSLNLSLAGIKEITPLCATASARCSPTNTGSTGEGTEEHTYTGILDFNKAPFLSLKNCTGRIIISASVNARNQAITTGPDGNLYTQAEIDISKAPCNSSPALTSEPIAILCCNQPFFFNNGALDTANFDSLSYKWISPQRNYGSNTSYTGGFTFNNPFTVYDPRSIKGNPIPNAQPPIGLYLDPLTGDIILTPTDCEQITVAVIQVTEWRKNDLGVYEIVGITRRDMQFIVKECPGNNPPRILGDANYDVCEGSNICFRLTTKDDAFVDPNNPTNIPPPDTVKISWNRGIQGATFTVINPTDRLPTGEFCWTPGAGTASDLPYTFTVTAKDDACPLNAVSVRAFRVLVKHRAKAERLIDTLECGLYALNSEPEDGFRGFPNYEWRILDSNLNNITDPEIAAFTVGGRFLSPFKVDSIQFKTGGKYIIQHKINNALNCPTVYFDTIIVPPLLEVDLSIGPDTFVCAGTDILFKPYLANTTPPIEYQWSTMGVNNDGTFIDNTTAGIDDNKDTFLLTIPNVQYDTAVSVFIKDKTGCTSEDTVQVFLKANPLAILPEDPRICSYDSILIIPNLDSAYWVDPIVGDTLVQGDTLYKEWFYNGAPVPFSIEDSVTIHNRGSYVIRVTDSLNCMDTDTMFLFVNDTVVADAGQDDIFCFDDTITLFAGILDTAGNSNSGFYTWQDITNPASPSPLGTNQTYKIVATDDQTFRLGVFQTQENVQCFDDDTVSHEVNQLPIIELAGDMEECCDFGDIALVFRVNVPTGNPITGKWSCTSDPQLVVGQNTFKTADACDLIASPDKQIDKYVTYTYEEPTTGCINKDSITIRIKSLPELVLEEKLFCQDAGAVSLDQKIVLSPPNTSSGTPSWRCLDSNSASNSFMANMLENRGTRFTPDWWVNIDESVYEIQNEDGDTVVLEFTFRQNGCTSKDTVEIYIWKVPKVKFDSYRELCFDEGIIKLDSLLDVNLTGGVWSCKDSLGFRPCGELGGIVGDSINTLNSIELADVTTRPNSWFISYYHVETGCPAQRDTTLIINPLPNIDPGSIDADFCESQENALLEATPSGATGAWSSSDPAALVGGNNFSPQGATVFNTDIILTYNYRNPTTGCSNVDSLTTIVVKSPTVTTPPDTTFCREEGQMTVDINYQGRISGENTSAVIWGPSTEFGNQDRMSTTPYSDATDEILTLTLQNQKSDTFRVFTYADVQSPKCDPASGSFDIIVNPLPEATITNSNPAGCDPVDSDFGVEISNSVDPNTSTYLWDLGEGSTPSTASASGTYTPHGTYPVSLVLTSEFRCSTTLTQSVLVHPLPVASFVPNPDNYTTAALPKFLFNNTSTVDETAGDYIETYSWDFGDPLDQTDVSNEKDDRWNYPTDTATYFVTLNIETNNGCTSEFTYPVVIGPDLIVFIPNAFTPEGSGPVENEGFNALISGEKTMELLIFNRWGEILWESTKKEERWDGMYKGEPVQQDVYAYQLKVTALNDEEYVYTGTITVIR